MYITVPNKCSLEKSGAIMKANHIRTTVPSKCSLKPCTYANVAVQALSLLLGYRVTLHVAGLPGAPRVN